MKPDPDDDTEDAGAELSALMGGEPVALPAVTGAVFTDELHAAEIALLEAWSKLNPRQMSFVQHYCAGATGAAAARAAGFSAAGASKHAHVMLTEQKDVITAIDAFRAKRKIESEYSVEQAMSDAERVEALAIENRQFNAAVRAVEVKARLHGLLIDKSQVTVDTGPNVTQAMLLAAQLRAERARPVIVDAEYTEVEK